MQGIDVVGQLVDGDNLKHPVPNDFLKESYAENLDLNDLVSQRHLHIKYWERLGMLTIAGLLARHWRDRLQQLTAIVPYHG